MTTPIRSSEAWPTARSSKEEGQEEHPERHRAHPVDVQQHASSRSPTSSGNVVAWSSAGARGFKGSRKSTPFAAQLAAEDAAAKAMEHGVRTVTVFVKGPGAGRESALRALQRGGLQDHAHPRRHPDPAQRLPAAQAPPRLIDLFRAKRRDDNGSLHRSVCRLCRREDMKLFLKGDRCYTDKCAIERRPYPPGQHGQAPHQVLGLRRAAAREAEGQAHLRHRSSASSAATTTRPSRRKGVTGENLLQLLERRLDNVVYRIGFAERPRRGAPARAPRSLHGQRQEGQHPVVPGARRATWSRSARRAAEDRAHQRGARGRRPPWRAAVARARQGELQAARSRRCRRAKTSRCRSASSSSSSSTRSSDRASADGQATAAPDARRTCASGSTIGDAADGTDAASTNRACHREELARPHPAADARGRAGDADATTYGKFALRAARARLRHHARQLAAPRAALVAPGRGDHGRQDRRRAARVHRRSPTSSRT